MSREEEIKALIEKADQLQPPAPYKEFTPACFLVPPKKKGIKSSELIIQLICKSVIEKAAITREDIYRLYWLYKTDNETIQITEREWVGFEGWKDTVFDVETFIIHWRM
jgi:hypothetical protein